HDLWVVTGAIYAPLVYDAIDTGSLPVLCPFLANNCVVVTGVAKPYAMTGWRLGWSVWPKPLYEAARKLAVNAHSCVNASPQWAGIAALDGPQDCVTEMVAEFDRRRAIVVDGLNALPSVSFIAPQGAFSACRHLSQPACRP
ncbi:aminotransferase class I/II-fold pyridoxal phosphate-dependent enzyme, partial|nr:aminotransferase class I/II-fold pyridoxal phosphate-dependent enzyme [Escherichia coli]